MIVLTTSTTMQMYLASTSVLVVATSYYVDVNTNLPGYASVAASGTAGAGGAVTIVTSPISGNRLIQHIEIFNGDPSSQAIYILVGGQQVLYQASVASNATLQYTTNGGWIVPGTVNTYFPSGW